MRRPWIVGARIALFGIVCLGIAGLVTMGLWNLLVPAILHLPPISYWQALGLFLLSRVLFGRLGGGGWLRRNRLARGWHNLTPEERERFRRAMGTAPPTEVL
jgi:Ca2+/H+ antiporter, TMEM165/GDT1 family